MINSVFNGKPKAFYVSRYPRKSAAFCVVRQNSFQLNPSFSFNIYHHGLLRVAWPMPDKIYVCFGLVSLHMHIRPTTHCAVLQDPAEKRASVTRVFHVDVPALLLL